jgi:hypothetical protein
MDINQSISSVKVYLGSFTTGAGAMWAWVGENNQSIGATVGLIALVYTTIVFFQNQAERRERLSRSRQENDDHSQPLL